MTTRDQRQLARQLKELRREWKEWRTGQALYSIAGIWGMPWCSGPDGYGHQVPCEGCATRQWCWNHCTKIEQRAAELKAATP